MALLNNCINIVQTGLPQPCLLCSERVAGTLLCPDCTQDLPALPPARCPQCALPSAGGDLCGRCLKRSPAFDRTVAAYAYAFPLDALVRHCK